MPLVTEFMVTEFMRSLGEGGGVEPGDSSMGLLFLRYVLESTCYLLTGCSSIVDKTTAPQMGILLDSHGNIICYSSVVEQTRQESCFVYRIIIC